MGRRRVVIGNPNPIACAIRVNEIREVGLDYVLQLYYILLCRAALMLSECESERTAEAACAEVEAPDFAEWHTKL